MSEPPDTSDVPPSAMPSDTSLTRVLEDLDMCGGYTGQMRAVEGGVECFTCRHVTHPDEVTVEHLRRLEGASDPADLLLVVALTCPACGTPGTVVANYGPESSPEEAELLRSLERH